MCNHEFSTGLGTLIHGRYGADQISYDVVCDNLDCRKVVKHMCTMSYQRLPAFKREYDPNEIGRTTSEPGGW